MWRTYLTACAGNAVERLDNAAADPLNAAYLIEGQAVRLVDGRNDSTFYGIYEDRVALAVAEPAPFKIRMVPPFRGVRLRIRCLTTRRDL